MKVRGEFRQLIHGKQRVQDDIGSRNLERERVMRTSKLMFTAALLVSVSAAAQQVVESRQPAPASNTQITPGPERSAAGQPATPSAAAPSVAQPAAAPETSPQAAAPAPTPSA